MSPEALRAGQAVLACVLSILAVKGYQKRGSGTQGVYLLIKLSTCIAVPGLLVLLAEGRPLSSLGLRVEPSELRRTLLAAVLCAGILPLPLLVIVAGIFNRLGMLTKDAENLHAFGNVIPLRMARAKAVAGLFLPVLLTTAIPEELLFRGYLIPRLLPLAGPCGAVLASSALFSLAHLDRPAMLVHTFLGGALFGGAYLYTGTLYPVVLSHCAVNLLAPLVLARMAKPAI